MSRRHSREMPATSTAATVAAPIAVRISQHPTLSIKRLLIGLAFFLLSITLFISGAVILFAVRYISDFTSAAEITVPELWQTTQSGLQTTPLQTDSRKNILLLGVDELANRAGDPVFTDTMMLLSLNLESGRFSAVSLPRDLWSSEYQTKINALYYYGREKFPDSPEKFTRVVVEEMTGIPIHHTVVLSLDQVAEVIDLLGGVKVNVEEGFVDEQFPRSDVDIRTERDPAKLYQRVEFTAGEQVMNGERALQYIRSRKSSNLNQGTDDARAHRQQQIIAGMMNALSQPQVLRNAQIVGSLYGWYQNEFGEVIPVEELIATAKQLRPFLHDFYLAPQALSIQTKELTGVLVHPPESKYKQWVYEIVDKTAFQTELQQKLGM